MPCGTQVRDALDVRDTFHTTPESHDSYGGRSGSAGGPSPFFESKAQARQSVCRQYAKDNVLSSRRFLMWRKWWVLSVHERRKVEVSVI